jgi:hypothetical protein
MMEGPVTMLLSLGTAYIIVLHQKERLQQSRQAKKHLNFLKSFLITMTMSRTAAYKLSFLATRKHEACLSRIFLGNFAWKLSFGTVASI